MKYDLPEDMQQEGFKIEKRLAFVCDVCDEVLRWYRGKTTRRMSYGCRYCESVEAVEDKCLVCRRPY